MDILANPLRRRLLQAGTTLVGAGAFGLGNASIAAPALHTPRNMRALANSLKGRLLLPGENAYLMAALPNNMRYAHILPKAVAMCADAHDVELCLRWAIENREQFAIRSGGHNYAGFSTTRGLLIDVKPMNGISVDWVNKTATIQAGVSNQDMANFFSGKHWAIPSGRCPTVGASGLVLGGGWGFSATHSGLTCDSLLSTEVVLPTSKLQVVGIQANDSPGNPYRDLFWGMRGGGGGNFGINTAFTFQLHEVGDVTIFNITWKPGQQIKLLQALQDLQSNYPMQISTRSKAVPARAGAFPALNEISVTTLGQFFGSKEQAMKALQPVLDIAERSKEDIRQMSYWQARDYLITDDPNGMYDLRSSYVADKMSPEGLEMMLRWMQKWPGGALLPENMGIFFAIGGKVQAKAVDETAYPHRNANYIFEMECAWSPIDSPRVIAAQQQWLADYFNAMQPFVLKQSYVNFPNRDQPDWERAYYGTNLKRLSQVKRKYDPHNIFTFPQSIPLA